MLAQFLLVQEHVAAVLLKAKDGPGKGDDILLVDLHFPQVPCLQFHSGYTCLSVCQTAYENIGERVQFGNQIAQIQDGVSISQVVQQKMLQQPTTYTTFIPSCFISNRAGSILIL